MRLSDKQLNIRFGGNTYINTTDLVMCHGRPLFRVYRSRTDGQLAVDLDIYDAHGGCLALVRGGVLTEGPVSRFVVERTADRYAILDQREGRVVVEIQRRLTGLSNLDVTAAIHTCEGEWFEASPFRTNLSNQPVIGCILEDWHAGFSLPSDLTGAANPA